MSAKSTVQHTRFDNNALGLAFSFLPWKDLTFGTTTVCKQWKIQSEALLAKPGFWQKNAQFMQLKIPERENSESDSDYVTRLKFLVAQDFSLASRLAKIFDSLDLGHLKRYEIGIKCLAAQEDLPLLRATILCLDPSITAEEDSGFGAPAASFTVIKSSQPTEDLNPGEELIHRVTSYLGVNFSGCCFCNNETRTSVVVTTRSPLSQRNLLRIFSSCLVKNLKTRFEVVGRIGKQKRSSRDLNRSVSISIDLKE